MVPLLLLVLLVTTTTATAAAATTWAVSAPKTAASFVAVARTRPARRTAPATSSAVAVPVATTCLKISRGSYDYDANTVDTNEHHPFEVLRNSYVVDPSTGGQVGLLDDLDGSNKSGGNKLLLVVVCPQLGDFDTFEYCELLAACLDDFERNGILMRVVGIGDAKSAERFSEFVRLPLDKKYLRVDPRAGVHRSLRLHRGPDWDIPDFVPRPLLEWFRKYVGASETTDARQVAKAWLNYMAMCAGISAPDTLKEIFRGYVGDKSAPERLRSDEVVALGGRAGGDDGEDIGKNGDDDEPFIVIKGTTDVKLGPIRYRSLWKDETGYQRPAELATVRLRGLVEVLEHFDEYVPDQTQLAFRGATYLFDLDESALDSLGRPKLLYEHRNTGVLAYSATMARPLTFLEPYIGASKALNPLGLGDQLSLDQHDSRV